MKAIFRTSLTTVDPTTVLIKVFAVLSRIAIKIEKEVMKTPKTTKKIIKKNEGSIKLKYSIPPFKNAAITTSHRP